MPDNKANADAQRPEPTPRLYNLIEVARNHSKATIRTRCLRKDGGAWEGWAGRVARKQ